MYTTAKSTFIAYHDEANYVEYISQSLISINNYRIDLLGASIAEVILQKGANIGLDMDRCGQSYDGAANMSGAIKGVSKIISDKYPLAVYQHCRSHCLNLSLMKACSGIPEIGKPAKVFTFETFDFAQILHLVICTSRYSLILNILECLSG